MEREESIKKHSSALNPRMLLLKILRLKEKFQAFRIRCIMLILGNLHKTNQNNSFCLGFDFDTSYNFFTSFLNFSTESG